jgi:hypothetical protein
MQSELREFQFCSHKSKEDPNEWALKQFAAVADQIPKSRLPAAVRNLMGLMETVKRNCEDVWNVRTQFELESDTIVAAYRQTNQIHHRKIRVHHGQANEVQTNVWKEQRNNWTSWREKHHDVRIIEENRM